MAKNAYLGMRIDPDVKAKAEAVFAKDGISISEAALMFLIASLHEGGFPFALTVPGGSAEELYEEQEAIVKREVCGIDPPGEPSKEAQPSSEMLSNRKKQGRNELCNCGSGQKYKRCCGR
ncbi:type II toxin-antitoxin system RelB/DinJ family antitoxin [Synergistaceae bacterium OttesenSCG-928-D05]|nr:type II toxin-antitoxin system RelB/DinJ family antitoxin [Synergistaceae bacterium OttesenSCG-928-D05]